MTKEMEIERQVLEKELGSIIERTFVMQGIVDELRTYVQKYN